MANSGQTVNVWSALVVTLKERKHSETIDFDGRVLLK